MPILESALAITSSHRRSGTPLDADELSRVLRERYLNNDNEAARRKRAWVRGEFYRDAGDDIISEDIDAYFDDPVVRRLRKRFVATAKYNNVTKRVVNELSVVYLRPAKRHVSGGSGDDRYQEFQRAVRKDAVMRRANRLLNLHRNVWLGFRVRVEPNGDRTPVWDIVPPSSFHAISDPLDPSRMLGMMLDSVAGDKEEDPHYIVWTHEETWRADGKAREIEGTRRAHGFGRIPGILAHAEAGGHAQLLEDTVGEDLTAAHRAVWLENILAIKESKSANKQAVFSGDLSTTASDQPADSEQDLVVGEGVSASTLDRAMDLSAFAEMADHILERAAANYGIPPSILRHQGATSGFEIQLRRIGIQERRREQEVVFRELEREMAEVESMVLSRDLPALAFSPVGWSINFGEMQQPLSAKEANEVFEQERRLGLTDTPTELIDRDPDLDFAGAMERMQAHIDAEVIRNQLMRPLKQINGSASMEQEQAEDSQLRIVGEDS